MREFVYKSTRWRENPSRPDKVLVRRHCDLSSQAFRTTRSDRSMES